MNRTPRTDVCGVPEVDAFRKRSPKGSITGCEKSRGHLGQDPQGRRPVSPLLVVLLLFSFISGRASAEGKKHPPLVDPAKAKCTTCHAAVMQGGEKHPAAEDCTNCHSFSQVAGQTTVALTDSDPKLCLTCHDFEKFVESDPKKRLVGTHPPVADGCLGCHSPHSSDQKHLLSKLPPALCADCHAADDLKKAHKLPVDEANCLTCHSPHGSANRKMLRAAKLHPPFAEGSCDSCHQRGFKGRKRSKSLAETCSACHDLGLAAGKETVHGAVSEGKCTGCHDPHMSDRPKFLKADGPELCLGCHDAIRARLALASTHPPAKASCLGCHLPHHGPEPKLLVKKVPELCLGCHAEKTEKAGKSGKKPKKGEKAEVVPASLRAAHLGADLTKLDCLTCHDPHGSATKKLVGRTSVHPPVADGSCDSCHEEKRFDKLAEKGGKALCATCHDVEETAKSAKHKHGALESAECIDCHSPHASRQEKLVKGAPGEVCATCHPDQAAGENEVAHGAIAAFGCQACHEPHGGANPKLLRRTGSELCMGCHVTPVGKPVEGKDELLLLDRWTVSKARGAKIAQFPLSRDGAHDHPVLGHRVLGMATDAEIAARNVKTDFRGPFECRTCHDPHKGRSRLLLVNGGVSAMDVCQRCHAK